MARPSSVAHAVEVRFLTAWLRRHRPFDRRLIRDPAERDRYWETLTERLSAIQRERETASTADEQAQAQERVA